MPKSPGGSDVVSQRARRCPYRVQVLDRTLQLFDVLAGADREMGPAELAGRLALHKSTIHSLLVVLERHRLIRKNPTQGKYGLGMKLFELGNRAVARLDLRDRAEPLLERLVDETHETAHISVLDGTEMLSIANVEGRWTLRTPSTVGRRTPVHCTSAGKAVIAFLPDRVLADLLADLPLTQYTRHTLITRGALKRELLRVRERGFAVDNEEVEAGLRCVGAPIRNHRGRVVASMSIAGPAFRITEERLPALILKVVAAAHDLSKDLGYAEEQRASGE